AIALGQRVESYAVQYWDGRAWQTASKGTTIGHKKLDRFEPVTAQRVRLVVEKALACPTISAFGLYFARRTTIREMRRLPMLASRTGRRLVTLLALLAGFLSSVVSYAAEQSTLLWEIGKADNSFAEFALAPNAYSRLREDGFCVVGQFQPDRDWPYVQPGPVDAWGGARSHTFTVVFGLKTPPKSGTCRLLVDLVDTHWGNPPELRIDVNNTSFKHPTPRGAGDESIRGQAAKGKECTFDVAFPAEALRAGVNEIGITTTTGSWILYDWVGLETPTGVELVPVQGTVVGAVRSTPALIEKTGRLYQPLQIPLRHFGEPVEAVVRVTGAEPVKVAMHPGIQTIDAVVPAVEKDTPVAIGVDVAGKTIASQQLMLSPVRKWEVYLLPHSHVDIGYTLVQTEVEKRQWSHLDAALAACLRTANYPAGSRYKWNVEVLWAGFSGQRRQ
ncbi:MAG TPA: polysaccharide lyase family protein, partial [Tepidisphaeraceae bacterium]|nr:polysaccharide lyase family protein [Tepidisphaeraceae bacterium]